MVHLRAPIFKYSSRIKHKKEQKIEEKKDGEKQEDDKK